MSLDGKSRLSNGEGATGAVLLSSSLWTSFGESIELSLRVAGIVIGWPMGTPLLSARQILREKSMLCAQRFTRAAYSS